MSRARLLEAFPEGAFQMFIASCLVLTFLWPAILSLYYGIRWEKWKTEHHCYMVKNPYEHAYGRYAVYVWKCDGEVIVYSPREVLR